MKPIKPKIFKNFIKLTGFQPGRIVLKFWPDMPYTCLFSALAFFCCFSGLNVFSQTPDANKKNESWGISFGSGLSYAGKGEQSNAGGGISHRIALDHQVKRFAFSAFITGNQGGKVNYDDYLRDNSNSTYLTYDFKHEWFFDLGLQVGGVAIQSSRVSIMVMTGLSLVTGKQIVIKADNGFFSSPDFYDYYVDREFSALSIGIPVEAKVHFKMNDKLGVGLCVHANFNQVETFYGITLNLIRDLNKREKSN